MTTGDSYPRILVIAVWFGALPEWFPLWLTSCRLNPDLDWLLVTDASATSIEIPRNVHIVHARMDDLAERVQMASGVRVHFNEPYKACDYRPLYWSLLDLAPGDWDFWGHCDLDMVFGNIRSYLTPDLLAANDRVFGVGHFSIYRNDEKANLFYRLPHPALDYRDILSDPRPRGFDEHLGVNRIWRLHGGRFHEDESVVADIDPHIAALRRTSTHSFVRNSRRQVFGFDRGRVFRLYQRGRRLFTEDFMYMHFQKRRFTLPPLPADCEAAWLTPSGFVPMDGEPMTTDRLDALNPGPSLFQGRELLYRLRRGARLVGHKARSAST